MAPLILPKLPVIDFGMGNLKPGASDWLSISNEVRHALQDYGIFIAKYDKVPLDLHNVMLKEVEGLFNLSQETKIRTTFTESPVGYVPKRPSIPLREGFSFNNALTLEGAQKFTEKMWPDGNDKFCEIALLHSKLLSELYQMVVRMIFESYGVDKYYESHLAAADYHLGFAKYRVPEENESNVGLSIHMDKCFADILDQNLVKALEIETKDGDWITFEPAPSYYVFVAGEVFNAWSNGRIHAPYHKVTMRGNETKYTTVLAAYMHGIVQPPEELVDNDHPPLFKPFSNAEYLKACRENAETNPNYSLKDFCGV